jgi:hypothetical protein
MSLANLLRSLGCATLVSVLAVLAADAPSLTEKLGYYPASFALLASFPFNPPEPDPNAKPGTPPPSAARQIPPAVKALDGQRVVVTGFMLPVKMERGLVTEILLLRDQQACCYGATPQINEFVVVKMTKGGVKAVMDTPVEFYGTLSVKEIFEDGFLANIYTLDAEMMRAAPVE